MADAEKVPEAQNGPSQSKVVLAKPRLGGFGGSGFPHSDTSKSSNPFGKIGSGSVLRPPQLKPVLGGNPFLRISTENVTDNTPKEDPAPDDRLKDSKETKDPTKESAEAPKFVPLGAANSAKTSNPVPTPTQPSSSSSSSGFVFGQNLSERAMVAEGINNGGTGVDHSSTNGTSELLFSNAASKVENTQEDGSSAAGEGLAAAAAEYEQSHARQPVVTNTDTTTGEEDETNVLQMTCRLFAWEAGSWRERGRGALRLNDGGGGSRLVCRALGSLRVVLNTKLWPEMVAERAGARSLRITAADVHRQVKVFLVMATPPDIAQLHRELTTRIALATAQKSSTTTHERVSDEHSGDSNYIDEESLGGSTDHFSYDNDDDLRPKPEENGKDINEDGSEDNVEDNNIDDNKDNEMKEEQSKSLKRKDAELEEATPKRQCPEVVIE